MKLNCIHVDTCLSDFWSGHHLAHVQIPVWRGMSAAKVRDAIRDELKQGAVAGSDDIAHMLSWDMVKPEDEKRADMITRAAYAAVNRDVKPATKGARKLFMELEPQSDDDCSDTVYAFFVFKEV